MDASHTTEEGALGINYQFLLNAEMHFWNIQIDLKSLN